MKLENLVTAHTNIANCRTFAVHWQHPFGAQKWKQMEDRMPTIIIILLLLVFLAMLLTPTKINDETLRKPKKKKPNIKFTATVNDEDQEIELYF